MSVRKILLSLFLTVMTVLVYAQDGPFVFDSTTWDFGDIEESAGPVKHTFLLRNISSKEQHLDMVIPSCDCTTAQYPMTSVLPGGTTEITVTYDPTSLPGQFRQNVRVFTAKSKVVYRLYIEGNVLPRDKSVDEQCPYYIADGLQSSSLLLRFGFARKGDVSSKSFNIVNTSKGTLNLKYEAKGVKVSGPFSLSPGEIAPVTVAVTPENIGTFDGTIYIYAGNRGKAVNVLGYGVQYEKNSSVSPSFRFEPTRAVFKRDKAEINFYNDGNKALTIFKIEFPDGISSDFSAPMRIEVGKKASVRFNCSGFQGEAVARVYSDDPERPMREILCKY